MSTRTLILLIGSLGITAFVGLILFVTTERRSAQEEQRKKNIIKARLANGVPAEGYAKEEGTPKYHVEGAKFEFGTILPNAKVSRQFKIMNTGDATLTLQVVGQSCSCIETKLSGERVPPGEEATLDLTLNSGDNEDKRIYHEVTLLTNDPLVRFGHFYIEGTFQREVWLDRKWIDFDYLNPAATKTLVGRIVSNWDEGFVVTALRVSENGFTTSVKPLTEDALKELDAKNGYEISITCSGDVPSIVAEASFNVTRNGSDTKTGFKWPVMLRRYPKFAIYGAPGLGKIGNVDEYGDMPLGQFPLGKGATFTYTVKARGEHKRLEVKELKVTPSFLQVELKPAEDAEVSGLHKLLVRIPEDAPEGSYQGEVRGGHISITFTDPEYKEVKLQPSFAITDK